LQSLPPWLYRPAEPYVFRPWSDTKTPYIAGRPETPVWPGNAISKAVEHCVPFGRPFAISHDAHVDKKVAQGVPDVLANIPTMPGVYIETVKQEGGKAMGSLQWNLLMWASGRK
jgi:hypothetical protein